MTRKLIYRKKLLQAIEAFLKREPSSQVQAQHLIQQCVLAMQGEIGKLTLNEIVWHFLVRALTDSVYYENEVFLQETRDMLLGRASQSITRAIFLDNYTTHFTLDETEWYEQLLGMLDFIAAVPFTEIHHATMHAWQEKETWATTRRSIPEAIQAEKIEEEYQSRKGRIEAVAERNPAPENRGEETMYHLVLQEITNVLTGLSIGRAAVYCGYPLLAPPYSGYGKTTVLAPGRDLYALNMSERIVWARRVLGALAGEGGIFLSCRFGKAPTFDSDLLFVVIH